MSIKPKQGILIAGAGIVLLGAGFGGGVWYQKLQQPAASNGFSSLSSTQRQQMQTELQSATTPQQRQQIMQKYGVTSIGGRNRAGGGGNVIGTIISKDATSLTIKASDGSTRIVNFDATTNFMTETKASSDAANNNATVTVSGTPNSNGSITAQNIRIQQ